MKRGTIIFNHLILLIFLVFNLTALRANTLSDAIASKHSDYPKLNRKQIEFIDLCLLPLLGKALLKTNAQEIRPISVDENSVSWQTNSVSQTFFKVEWSESEAKVRYQQGHLILPASPTRLDSSSLKPILYQALIGSPLHPLSGSAEAMALREALGEPRLRLREVQENLYQVTKAYLNQGTKNRLLIVGPPSMGKSKQILEMLRLKFKNPSNAKLHIVVSDSENLVAAFVRDELKPFQSSHEMDFDLIQWGAGHKSESIEDLVKRSAGAKRPLILCTTMASLRGRVFKSRDKREDSEIAILKLRHIAKTSLKLLLPHLASYSYDEVHHSSATLARIIIEELLASSKDGLFINGTTATPNGTILSLFGEGQFWAYLDEPSIFLSGEKKTPSKNRIERVIDQISTMIDAGECTPFDKIHFIDPVLATKPSEKNTFLFVKKRGRLVLNPNNLNLLIEKMLPHFSAKKPGFITVGTTDEADLLVQELNAARPDLRFASYHSRSRSDQSDENSTEKQKTSKEILEETERQFRSGNIDVLIAVGKLDEGLNFPSLKIFFDLNHSFTARQFIQRLGRLLRLGEGKTGIEIVSLMLTNEENIRDNLSLLNGLIKLKTSIYQKSDEKRATDDNSALLSEINDLRDFRKNVAHFWKSSPERREEIYQMRIAAQAFIANRADAPDLLKQALVSWTLAYAKTQLPTDRQDEASDIIFDYFMEEYLRAKKMINMRDFIYYSRRRFEIFLEQYLKTPKSPFLHLETLPEDTLLVDQGKEQGTAQLRDKMLEVIDSTLTERERNALFAFYKIPYNGSFYSSRDLRDQYGLSKAWIYQLKNNALRKLQNRKRLISVSSGFDPESFGDSVSLEPRPIAFNSKDILRNFYGDRVGQGVNKRSPFSKETKFFRNGFSLGLVEIEKLDSREKARGFFDGEVLRVRQDKDDFKILRRDWQQGEWRYFLDAWYFSNISGNNSFRTVSVNSYIPAQGEVERTCSLVFSNNKSPFDFRFP